MIRLILLGTAFVGITAALLIFQPGLSAQRDEPGTVTGVTRAASDLTAIGDPITDPAPAPATVRPAEPSTAPAADDLSRGVLAALAAGTDLPDPAAPPSAGSGADRMAALADALAQSRAQDDQLARTTQSLLAELGPEAATGQDLALQDMTQDVLAGLGALKPKSQGLDTLVVQALREGQSDAYLDALLNEARTDGRIAVPEALITSEGRVDTQTLLATLVQRSVAAGAGDAADPALTAGLTAEATRPPAVTRPQSYVVQPGDSLAAIAYRFYGETALHTRIFEANRDRVAAPDRIRIGQTLTIPAL
ncbi:LysM peptidoglycan-binding domain-containing protein [Pseudoponticoccus marisrubri]|uniref:LysM domain-containing protein n=1 Tax=Pseudoponticoccus marisrubri TaxID=1685382 RepID=A0A0W7WHT4_9RHOB|nr:LysM peptidoglycan-binding domain-containing protein [Pseudoponticoccus marisrubri]KUF10141.1 hypothetical protein AVJ23_13910 [Pseudoponticoccus marisrubri]